MIVIFPTKSKKNDAIWVTKKQPTPPTPPEPKAGVRGARGEGSFTVITIIYLHITFS